MMDAREEFGRRLLVPRKDGNLMLISLLFQSSIPFPAIGMYNTAGLNRFFDERLQTARGRVSNSRHPYSSGAFSIFLGCNHYQHLFLRLPSPQPLFRGSHVSLVNLDSDRQLVTSGADHGTPQFVEPPPRGQVRDAQNPLHAQGAGPVLLVRHMPHRAKPQRQRKTTMLKDRSNGHRRLSSTSLAQQQSTAHPPCLCATASRTLESVRPSQLLQIKPACLFGRKLTLKFHQRSWVYFHTHLHYQLGLVESNG